ncbi:MAG: hypothetical protein CL553_13460 [Alcanivorax sp.]|nr:hypothetical protein [Alcanivorax sp.]
MISMRQVPIRIAAVIAIACFIAGLLTGPKLQKVLFGYRSAEECMLDGHANKYGRHACYQLYPPAQR